MIVKSRPGSRSPLLTLVSSGFFATLGVPIDYDDPSVGTVSLALNRARANAAQGYRGTVLINPGGPGASGKAYLASAAPLLRTYLPGFDFIGFDPRGVMIEEVSNPHIEMVRDHKSVLLALSAKCHH